MRRLVFLLWMIPTVAFSQQAEQYIDSLKSLIPKAKEEDRPELFLRLSELSRRTSLDESLDYAFRGLEAAIYQKDNGTAARAYDILGKSHYIKGNFILASDCFRKGLNMAEDLRDSVLLAHLHNSLGIISFRQSKYEDALQQLLSSQMYWEGLGDEFNAATILINIGALYKRLNEFDTAIQTLKRALRESEKLNNPNLKASAYHNLGNVYEELNDYPQALSYYEQSLEIKKQHSQMGSLTSTLGNIARIYVKDNQLGQARKIYRDALKIGESSDRKSQLQQLEATWGEILLENGHSYEAEDHLLTALDLAELMEDKGAQKELHLQLAELYGQQRKYKLGYDHLHQYKQVSEKLYEARQDKQFVEMQTRQQLEEKEQTIQQLQMAQFQMRQEEKQGQLKFYSLLVLSIAIIIALLATFSRYRTKLQANIQLSQQKAEIEQKNELLEHQSQAIHLQNTRLMQSNQELEQFAYAASHDLREPLRTIRSYLQLLQRRYQTTLEASAQEFLEFALDGAVRLDNLLTDLLEYSRIGRTGMSRVKLDLNVVLSQVKKGLQSQIEQTKATIEWDQLPEITGYKTEIYLLFQNLISNAIKFHRPDVPPEIHISASKENQQWQIQVRDQGIGIPPQFHERVFQMYQRLHHRSEFEGSGMGLAICQKIIRNHGGEISIDSDGKVGTTFTISLPITAESYSTNG
ncbi:tetratricopeptide repeat protein [Pontibacter sp. G13]|uniref:tetratricopeptide repeat protein n=1 Tax=Pontibacter sp. G13 TaxID=3074898 RepID=UPI00288A01EF|nr:tetratricopeptide repeat protein [Pontibacter sp. G13]WNJ17723.1 tetratricopeptide repeat protein [Pontibacter sp. G13]